MKTAENLCLRYDAFFGSGFNVPCAFELARAKPRLPRPRVAYQHNRFPS